MGRGAFGVAFAGAVSVVGVSLLHACRYAEYPNPCPEHFDVAAWCGADRCTEDGDAAPCVGTCKLHGGKVFSVPISEFAASLDLHELELDLAGSWCGKGEEPLVSIDGVAAVRAPVYPDSPSGPFVYRWDPFPAAPKNLELFIEDPMAGGQCSVIIGFADATCEAANPGGPL